MLDHLCFSLHRNNLPEWPDVPCSSPPGLATSKDAFHRSLHSPNNLPLVPLSTGLLRLDGIGQVGHCLSTLISIDPSMPRMRKTCWPTFDVLVELGVFCCFVSEVLILPILPIARLSSCFRHTGRDRNPLPPTLGSLAVVGLVASGGVHGEKIVVL